MHNEAENILENNYATLFRISKMLQLTGLNWFYLPFVQVHFDALALAFLRALSH